MKKITLYRIINAILIATFLVALVVQSYIPMFSMGLIDFWFPTFCLFVSVSMMFKTLIFKTDNTLWLSICLFLVSAALFLAYLMNFKFIDFLPLTLLIPGVSSLITALVFKIMFQLKVFFVLFVMTIPLVVYSLKLVDTWWLIVILVVCLWVVILGSRLIPDKWYNRKK